MGIDRKNIDPVDFDDIEVPSSNLKEVIPPKKPVIDKRVSLLFRLRQYRVLAAPLLGVASIFQKTKFPISTSTTGLTMATILSLVTTTSLATGNEFDWLEYIPFLITLIFAIITSLVGSKYKKITNAAKILTKDFFAAKAKTSDGGSKITSEELQQMIERFLSNASITK